MKKLLTALLITASATAMASDAEIKSKLQALGAKNIEVKDSPVKGLKTAVTDQGILYVSENGQYVLESIMYSAMTLYSNGGASRTRLAESHHRWEDMLASKKEEKLSRTQELNTAKIQALRELGYTKIDEKNASEVLNKIAEIMSQKF